MAQVTFSGFKLEPASTVTYQGLGYTAPLTADNTPTLFGTAEPNSAITVTGSLSGGVSNALGSTVSNADGTWEYTSDQVSSGRWYFSVSDPSGPVVSRPLFVDNVPPTARFSVPSYNVTSHEITFFLVFQDNTDSYGGYGSQIFWTRPAIDASDLIVMEQGISGSYIQSVTPSYHYPTNGYDISVHVGSGAGSIRLTLDADRRPITDAVGNALQADVTSSALAVGADAVFRFYDTSTGNHFYTTSSNEKAQIDANLPAFRYEGIQWGAPETGPEVYRFFDVITKDHFFTISASERDSIIASPSQEYVYEGVAFHAYGAGNGDLNGASGAVTLERFYNKITGVHHFSANADETVSIKSGAQGPGWVDEGPAFAVHPPTSDLLVV